MTPPQLIPHADVVFLATTTFAALAAPQPGQPGQLGAAPATPASPRALLLSLARHAPAHALLVLNAGRDGAALLSLPTSEYLQSSGWSPTRPNPNAHAHGNGNGNRGASNGTRDGVESVRSGSDFWAGGPADGSFTSRGSAGAGVGASASASGRSHRRLPSGESFHPMDDDDDEEEEEEEEQGGEHAGGDADGDGDGDGDGRQTPQPEERAQEEEELDEEGAHAAFVAGMIWALSRRVLPGPPYVPGPGPDGPEAKAKDGAADLGIRWRLDECLRCVPFGSVLGRTADEGLGSRPSWRVGRRTAGLTTSVRPA